MDGLGIPFGSQDNVSLCLKFWESAAQYEMWFLLTTENKDTCSEQKAQSILKK